MYIYTYVRTYIYVTLYINVSSKCYLSLSVCSHNDSVQCLAFNPLSSHLVSCGVTEVGKLYLDNLTKVC